MTFILEIEHEIVFDLTRFFFHDSQDKKNLDISEQGDFSFAEQRHDCGYETFI